MTLDLALIAFIVLGAAVGLWLGAWKQLVHFAAWLASVAAVYLFAGPVARALEKPLEAPFFLAFGLSSVGLFVLTNVVVRIAAAVIARLAKREEGSVSEAALGAANRVGGTLIGGGKAALYVWAALSVLLLLPVVSGALGQSSLARAVARHNLVEWAFARELAAVRRALQEAQARTKGSGLESVAKDPRFAAIARNARVRDALARGDVQALSQSPELVALVTDRDAMAKVLAAVGSAQESVGNVLAPPAPPP